MRFLEPRRLVQAAWHPGEDIGGIWWRRPSRPARCPPGHCSPLSHTGRL